MSANTATRKPIKTDADIRNAKPESAPYRRAVGRGLYLEVRPTGAKLFRYRYRLPGTDGIRRENLYAVGAYGKGGKERGEFTLAQAEVERNRLRELVKQGIHPVAQRREQRVKTLSEAANTFRSCALKWLELKRQSKSPAYIQQIERQLIADVFPHIGTRAMNSITHADVADVIDRKAGSAPTVAYLLQQHIGSIFRYSMRKGLANHDPAYVLRGTVERKPVQSKAPLLKADFPDFFKALHATNSNKTTKIALELLAHLFVRPGELCGATWPEFDLDGAVWKIPAERMKGRREHWVPLSPKAVALLRELHPLTGGQKWLFPNGRDPKNKHMTPKALNKSLYRMGYEGRFSAHAFRATASTALNDLGFRHDAIEMQMAHKEKNATRASYNMATYWDARVEMMKAWSRIIQQWASGKGPDSSNVVRLKAAQAA